VDLSGSYEASGAVSTHNDASDAHGVRLPPTPVGQDDGRILVVDDDALVYGDAPEGGGGDMDTTQLLPPETLVVRDDFARADTSPGPSALGTALTGQAWTGRDLSGAAWLVSDRWGYFFVDNDAAKAEAPTGGDAYAATVTDAAIGGSADLGVTWVYKMHTTTDANSIADTAILLRYHDKDNMLVAGLGDRGRRIFIDKISGGTRTRLVSSIIGFAIDVSRFTEITASLNVSGTSMFIWVTTRNQEFQTQRFELTRASDETLFDDLLASTTAGIYARDGAPRVYNFNIHRGEA
jgi:hypothetical protein